MPHPRKFQRGGIGWIAFIEAPAIEELTDEQRAAIRPVQLKSEYYRMLALDPAILRERTAVDTAIFHSREGMQRGERELCAAVSSMVTGCLICTSTHVGFASTFSKREDDVMRIMNDGFDADVGSRWNTIVNAAASLAEPQPSLSQLDVDFLRGQRLAADEILDLVHSTAFFAWANRLLLTLGDATILEPA